MKKIKFYQALCLAYLGILGCSATEFYSVGNLLNDHQTTATTAALPAPPAQPHDESAGYKQTVLAAYPNLTPEVVKNIVQIFPNGYDFTQINALYGLIEKDPQKLLVISGRWPANSAGSPFEFANQVKGMRGLNRCERGSMLYACSFLRPEANSADGCDLCGRFAGSRANAMTVKGFIYSLHLLDHVLFPRYLRAFRTKIDLLHIAISSFGGNLMTLKGYITKEKMQIGANDNVNALLYKLCGIPMLLSKCGKITDHTMFEEIVPVDIPFNIDTFNAWVLQSLVIDQLLQIDQNMKIDDQKIGAYIRALRKAHNQPSDLD